MRYISSEIAPSGHRQYLIALNIRELELLHGMAGKLKSDLPKGGPTSRLQHVCKEMEKTFAKTLKAAEVDGDDGKRQHLYPLDRKSVL